VIITGLQCNVRWDAAAAADTDTYILDSDEAVQTFALNGMWMSNDGRLGDERMFNEHRLNISRTQQVTRHVEHVVDTPRDPQVTITVTLGTYHNHHNTSNTLLQTANTTYSVTRRTSSLQRTDFNYLKRLSFNGLNTQPRVTWKKNDG